MSTLKTTYLQHPSASTPNITLASSGAVALNGAVTGGGMDLVNTTTFSAVSSVSLNNVFTSTYANYKIVFTPTSATVADTWIYGRLRAASSDDSAGNYATDRIYQATTTVGGDTNPAGDATKWTLCDAASGYVNRAQTVFDLFSPALTVPTLFIGSFYMTNSVPYQQQNWVSGMKTTTTAYDGISFITSSGNMSGTVRVYGYKN
jgi:hypothetical protein